MDLWEDVKNRIESRDYKRAEVIISRLLKSEITPHERTLTLLWRAKLRLLTGRQLESVADLEAIQNDPLLNTSPEFLEVCGDAYFQQYENATVGFADKQKLEVARHAYQQITTDFPSYANSGWIWYQLGRLELAAGQSSIADQYFRRALFEPSNLEALTAYCFERLAYIAFYDHRDYRFALTLIDRSIMVYPEKGSRTWLVQVYLLKSKIMQYTDLAHALKIAKLGLQVAGRHNSIPKAMISEALFCVIELASKLKTSQKDVLDFAHQFLHLNRAPAGIDVTWARVYEMLGDAQFALDKVENAIQSYGLMLQFNPYHPWDSAIRLRIANGYFHLGQHYKAIEIATTLTHSMDSTEQSNAWQFISQVYQALGLTDKAHDADQQWKSLPEVEPISKASMH